MFVAKRSIDCGQDARFALKLALKPQAPISDSIKSMIAPLVWVNEL